MKLIIGLGNPGDKYTNHRSNIGFKILDVIANNNDIDIRTKKKKSLIGKGSFGNEEIVLLKPQTFAELSGESALYIASFLRIKPDDIIVILEDYNLPIGRIVVEKGGEDKDHPAIENLAIALKSYGFIRVRIGIHGENPKKLPRQKYINQEFEPHENLKLIDIINDAESAIRAITLGDIEEVIDKYKN